MANGELICGVGQTKVTTSILSAQKHAPALVGATVGHAGHGMWG